MLSIILTCAPAPTCPYDYFKVGGAAVLVGGAIQGVTQIVRGVAATPDAIIQPSKGKWWNENEGKWIETNLTNEAKALESVPSDDKDILGKAEAAMEDDAKTSGGADTKVADM